MPSAKRTIQVAMLLAPGICSSLGAAGLTTIYYSGSSPDALIPNSLLSDGSGGFYGTMTSVSPTGAVFHLTPPTAPATAWTTTLLRIFAGGADGGAPNPGLAMDAKGNLYGTAAGGAFTAACPSGCGVVFQLTPPAGPPLGSGRAWTENILYAFAGGADGANPQGNLAIDKGGAPYGTAWGGPRYGVVYRLMPARAPAGGEWMYSVLYNFLGGTDASNPQYGVVFGKEGGLYGTAEGGASESGAVFQLTPPESPGGAWTETVLYTFNRSAFPNAGNAPNSGLVLGLNGAFYGTTASGDDSLACANGCGVVYSLTPPAVTGASWTYAVIYEFENPYLLGASPFGLLTAKNGELFGATYIGADWPGSVFALDPPSTPGYFWTAIKLWNFTMSQPTSLIESGGALYGTTSKYYDYPHAPCMGTVFQMTF